MLSGGRRQGRRKRRRDMPPLAARYTTASGARSICLPSRQARYAAKQVSRRECYIQFNYLRQLMLSGGRRQMQNSRLRSEARIPTVLRLRLRTLAYCERLASENAPVGRFREVVEPKAKSAGRAARRTPCATMRRRVDENADRKTKNQSKRRNPFAVCERVSTLLVFCRDRISSKAKSINGFKMILFVFRSALKSARRYRVCKPGSVHKQARVAVIYLRRPLPDGLKAYAFCRHRDSGGNRSGSLRSPEGVASDRVYRKPALP